MGTRLPVNRFDAKKGDGPDAEGEREDADARASRRNSDGAGLFAGEPADGRVVWESINGTTPDRCQGLI